MSKIGQKLLIIILGFIGLGSFSFGYYEDFNGTTLDPSHWTYGGSYTIGGGELSQLNGTIRSINTYNDFDVTIRGLAYSDNTYNNHWMGLQTYNVGTNLVNTTYRNDIYYLYVMLNSGYSSYLGYYNSYHIWRYTRSGGICSAYVDGVLKQSSSCSTVPVYITLSSSNKIKVDYIDDGTSTGPTAYTGTFNFNYGKLTNNVPINVKNYFNFNFQYNGSYSGDNTIKYKFGTGQSALGLYSPFQLIGNDNNFIIYLSGSQYILWDKDNDLKRNFSTLKKEIKIDRNDTEGIMTFHTYFYQDEYNPLNIVYSSSYSSTLGPINDYDPGVDVGFIGCLDTDLTCQLYYYGAGQYAYLTGENNLTYEVKGNYYICDFGINGFTDYWYSSDKCITKSYKFDDLGVKLYRPFNDLECGGEIGYTFYKKDNEYVEPQSLFFHWQNSECRTTGTFIIDGSGNVQEVVNPYYDLSGNVQSYNDDVFAGFTCDANNDGDVSIGEGITCPWTVLKQSYNAFIGGLSNIKKTITIVSKVGTDIKTTNQLLTGYNSSLANSDQNIYKKVLQNENVKRYTDFVLNLLLAIYFLLLIYFLFG